MQPLDPDPNTKFCHVARFTDLKPEDNAKVRFVTLNGKCRFEFDLTYPIGEFVLLHITAKAVPYP